MKKLAILLIALSLGGCANITSAIDATVKKVDAVYQTVTSPTTMYQVKNAYAAADQLVIDYRNYCWSMSYADILKDPVAKSICENRRAVVRKAQAAHKVAASAIQQADKFIAENPTLDASTLISAAWSAVMSFKSSTPAVQ